MLYFPGVSNKEISSTAPITKPIIVDELPSSDITSITLEHAARWGGLGGLVDLYEIDNEIVGQIPLERLSEFCPLELSPWSEAEGLTREDVETAISLSEFNDEVYSSSSKDVTAQWTKDMHAARIAYLVRYPSIEPIDIEFTEPGEPWMVLTDGWHRLAAAQFAGLSTICVSVSGFVEHTVAGLGAICRGFQHLESGPSLSL